MFLDITLKRNPVLLKTAFNLHQKGAIRPDTYVLDLDAIVKNAAMIKEEADKYGVKLYFMTKQFGRNPYIASKLMELGYDGAVAVDFREAEVLYENGIKIGHVGHLVQVPSGEITNMLLKKPEVITVYSVEKAREISNAAVRLNITQNIMLRVVDKGDIIFPGQYGGLYLDELNDKAQEILDLPNIILYGVTSFPCFLMDKDSKTINETHNTDTVIKAKELLEDNFGIMLKEINLPSATCVDNIRKIAECHGTHGEPGHGISGTTPIHAERCGPEIPAIAYVSEVSHNLGDSTYCYGGGYYRRSYIKEALVGKDFNTAKKYDVVAPDNDSIDYYLELKNNANVGDTAVFSFRTQIFVTRSEVAVVEGISTRNPRVAGIYDSLGRLLRSDVN